MVSSTNPLDDMGTLELKEAIKKRDAVLDSYATDYLKLQKSIDRKDAEITALKKEIEDLHVAIKKTEKDQLSWFLVSDGGVHTFFDRELLRIHLEKGPLVEKDIFIIRGFSVKCRVEKVEKVVF